MPTFRNDVKLGTKVPLIKTDDLDDRSVTNAKIADGSITKDKLQDKTIGVEKLDNELRQTIAAATGLPEDLVETIQNVDDTLKDYQSQLDDKQSQIDDKQQQITANDEDISLLQTRSTQMEETIKGIAATGGASQAAAVTYNNANSQLAAINIQSAIDELQVSKIDKTSIVQDFGDSGKLVMSQKAITEKLSELEQYVLKGIFFNNTLTPIFSDLNIGDCFYNFSEEKFKKKISDNTSTILELKNGNEIIYRNERYKFINDKIQVTTGNLSDFESLDNLDSIPFSNNSISYINGTTAINFARLCSDFILVNGLSIRINDGYLMYIYFYDKDKKLIGYKENDYSGLVEFNYPFTYFARLVFMHSDKTTPINSIKGVISSVSGIYENNQYEQIVELSKKTLLSEDALAVSKLVDSSEYQTLHSYQTGVSVGDLMSPTPVADSTISCWSSICKQGSRFQISGSGATKGRLWCFTDRYYRVLSVSDANAGGKGVVTQIIAPVNSAYVFINIDRYDSSTDYIKRLGGWVDSEMVKKSEQQLEDSEINQVLDNFGVKLVSVVGFATDYPYIKDSITAIGDIYYDYKNQRLRECTNVENDTFKTHVFKRTETYSIDGKIYQYDGNNLYSDKVFFERNRIALFKSLSLIHYSVSSDNGNPNHVNAARLCSPILYLGGNARVKVKDGYAFYYYIFNTDGTFMGFSESNNTDVQFPPIQCLARVV